MLESVANIIKTQKFPPVLLMFGEEEFLLEEAYNQLIEAVVSPEIASFNFTVLDGSEISQESIVEIASAFPMMADYRVVVVKHFDKLFSGRGTKTEQKSPLAKYFLTPSPTTFLLLLSSASELNGISTALNNPKQKTTAEKKLKNLKFPYSILLKSCEWVEYPRLYDREIPSWIARRFKTLKREITPDACELMIAQIGYSLRDLHNEIEKILIFVQDKPRITREDIINLIGASKTYNIFELQKFVGMKHLSRSIEIMQRMLAVDRQELLIITMITRYFMILWKLTEARKISKDHFELGKSVGISPFFIPEYLGALDKYSVPQIEQSFTALTQADTLIKTSSGNADIILQNMLIAIIGS